MPTPVFIVCSESGAVDRFTNLVSLYNVYDRIIITPQGSGEKVSDGHTPWLSIRVTAVWRSSPEERGEEFEYENSLIFPGKKEPLIGSKGKFIFKSRTQRFFVNAGSAPPTTDGQLQAVSRIRRCGEEDWLEQTYSIYVEQAEQPENVPAE